MLVKEQVENREELVKYYSDAGVLIHKIGTDEYYEEAVELATSTCEYEETDIPIDESEDSEDNEDVEEDEVADMRAALELLGVTK